MSRTVIFIDGEYVRKVFKKRKCNVDIPKFIEAISEKCNIGNFLLRTYYYTAPPYQSEKPTEQERVRYTHFQKHINFLKKQDSIEIRQGKLEKRGNTFEQKMVDILLSIDLVDLSSKKEISTVILVAGDSDFIPALQRAKNNGCQVILLHSHSSKEYHKNLWIESDKRIAISDNAMKSCSR